MAMKVERMDFDGIFRVDGRFATVNLVKGFKSSNEDIVTVGGTEYRVWDSYTSKPSAAIRKNLKVFPLAKGMKVVYLGMAEGKTASFFSDIVGREGLVYGIEISERSLRECMVMCEKRGNMAPMLGDARMPETYENAVIDKVDCVYEDVASNDQVQILIRNCQKFLKPKGYAMIAIKSQSIDVVKQPRQVYRECLDELGKYFEILDKVELDPFEKHHLFVVMRFR